MSKILEVKNATKRFGGLVANEKVTFDVDEGEIVGVVGPNGAGKTTLFNSISGAHPLTEGNIIFDGKDITTMKPHDICKLGIGRTFQIPQSLVELKVFENVLIGALCKRNDMDEAMAHVDEILELCGIADIKYELAGKLNVPQKKRLEIARAMATDPKLLLLDETMAGLNATERKASVDLIRKINSTGVAILTIEHNMDVVMNVSKRVVVLVSGKLLTIGTPEEVISNPEVISAYLGGGAKEDGE
ncbi:MAG: ABC transporter ATP-binding protein [Lachnospiraceae bacterium]|jgi:branched-chain amino acid transport system ATP-binding protein|nr:ABC transporter ATP-binding protein [Clostridiaceae bacterium]MDY3827015.1 ABC transporter ATP-binding protein [Lachnospiraceae bacterium]